VLNAGLGLWIVRRNVEALGGRVSAFNRADGGLCVRITLPCNGRL
jgi:two-component system sensor histidine kinase ChvG